MATKITAEAESSVILLEHPKGFKTRSARTAVHDTMSIGCFHGTL